MKTFTLNMMVALLVLSSFSLFSQIPSNGLVAYYPFSGNANDASGNGLNGTASSGFITHDAPPTLDTDRLGNTTGAYNFQPKQLATSYIDLATPAQLNFDSTHSFSIAAWIKYESFNATPTIVGCGGSNYAQGYQLALVNISGNDHAVFLIGSDYPNKQGHLITDTTVQPGAWLHLTAVYDQAAQTMQMYLNGVAMNLISYTGAGVANGTTMSTSACKLNATPAFNTQIGLTGAFPSTNIKGDVDDVLIYNRALSAGDVSNIYTATTGPNGIHEQNSEMGFVLAPSPTTGAFSIMTNKPGIENGHVMVYDLQGRLVLEREGVKSNEQFDISGNGAGTYLVKLETKDGFFVSKLTVVR